MTLDDLHALRPARQAYRADIDGLRAIAVLLVLAYHFHIRPFTGGFVGVDVFFVISGYLISQQILDALAGKQFSLVSFYSRRIRRIIPALAAVLLASAAVAVLLLLPDELVEFSKSLAAAASSTSNILFWSQTGYFDHAASTKPLLHTWSLGVEEQVYVCFPFFLLAIWRYAQRWIRHVVVVCLVLSFIASVVAVDLSPESAFYLPPFRAWEFLLGTSLALDVCPVLRSRFIREVLFAGGALLIFWSGVAYGVTTPFPGWAALAPCIGTAAIIWSGVDGPSWGGQGLGLKPLAFVGRISYSVYLVHWPVAAFENTSGCLLRLLGGRGTKVIELLLSLGAGALSWRFAEGPFRSGRLRLVGARLGLAFVGCVAGFLAFAAVVMCFDGFSQRFPPAAAAVASYISYDATEQFRTGTCFLSSKTEFSDYSVEDCLLPRPGVENDLLIGDSHAAQLWFGLSRELKGINLMQATASGCKPTVQGLGEARCRDLMGFIYKRFLRTHRVDRLLIAARWREGDLEALGSTLRWTKAHGLKVIVFGPVVEYDTPLPRLLALSIAKGNPAIPSKHLLGASASLDGVMSRMAREEWHVRYASVYHALCPAGGCLTTDKAGVPLQFDYGHLTGEGSIAVARALLDAGAFN